MVWFTLDQAPNFPRSMHFVNSLDSLPGNEVEEWSIRLVEEAPEATHEGPVMVQ
ncbi:MAG: hypothetical protein Q9M41_05175 [Paracoccaceae bacterium]|nr:hypothetical protein [Paracoccaceae bacterium]